MKILVTGGSNGMGKGVAMALAGRDEQRHEIIILCRSKELGEATIKEIGDLTTNPRISMVLCDLARLSDVRAAVEEIHSRHDALDGIFINAGLGYAPGRAETEDGMDPHFQVNYLSQFMLTLNLLDLLEKSEHGARVVFNVNPGGEIFWDDLQMKNKWGYERGVMQGMIAKRMFYGHLHRLHSARAGAAVSFYGFRIPKTVWTNQLNIIPFGMKAMATLMKLFGMFITIEECGAIMAPLFCEGRDESLDRSGKLISWKKEAFIEMEDDQAVLDPELQGKLWQISLDLCDDEKTTRIAQSYTSASPGR